MLCEGHLLLLSENQKAAAAKGSIAQLQLWPNPHVPCLSLGMNQSSPSSSQEQAKKKLSPCSAGLQKSHSAPQAAYPAYTPSRAYLIYICSIHALKSI